MLKVFRVTRCQSSSWYQDYEMVVVAHDNDSAENIARWRSTDFRISELEVEEIDLTEEGVVLVANVGG